jgi:hypothetical protein
MGAVTFRVEFAELKPEVRPEKRSGQNLAAGGLTVFSRVAYTRSGAIYADFSGKFRDGMALAPELKKSHLTQVAGAVSSAG